MKSLFALRIRTQLLLVTLIVALPAAAVIVYSGVRLRTDALGDARLGARQLAEDIAQTQAKGVAAAQQLLTVLSQLPDVRERRPAKVRALLESVLRLNPEYSNIFVADLAGEVWASAVRSDPFNIRDRRYFRDALDSGKLASGEYIISRATTRPAFNFGLPYAGKDGAVAGVICMGFNLHHYRRMLAAASLPAGTSYLLLDHRGVVLARGIDPDDVVGRSYGAAGFQRMVDGPDAGSEVAMSFAGDRRLIAWRKVRLEGERTPYMFVRVGVPVDAIVAKANRALLVNVAMLLAFLALAALVAGLVAKYAIVDRVARIADAARRLAAGDLQARVAEQEGGGELGALARSFDDMAGRLAERERALSLSQELYRRLFEVESDALFLLELATGRVLEANPAATRLLGYSSDELLQLTNTDLSTVPETTRPSVPGDPPPLVERTMRRQDGSLVAVEASGSYFTMEGKQVVVAALRDISGRKRAEAENRGLAEQLFQAQKMEAVGRLAGGVAHDFNNLLTVIAGHGDLALLQVQDPGLREDIEVMRKAADSAAALTRQLLAFSRKQVLQPEIVQLNGLVASTDRMLRRVIGEDVQLKTRLEPDLWRVRADPVQVQQLIMNLVVNSRDAMPRGGTLTIETANVVLDDSYTSHQKDVRPGEYVLLAVSDTGEGMDAATLARVFEPFFTTKKEGKGTGLGLSTVYGIVKQSGGHVDAYSELGLGSTFKVYLPRAEASAEAPAPGAPDLAPEKGGATVLVAEDSDGVRRLIQMVLSRHGFEVLEARNGEEALAIAERHAGAIDLLVTDVVMPVLGGWETAERLSARRPGLKVLFMSGYTEDAILTKGIISGELDFLEKPFTPFALEQKVQEILARPVSLDRPA